MEANQLAIFEKKAIRQTLHNGETYFSVIDIIDILTDSKDAKRYWSVLKSREPQLTTICSSLKLLASDGKQRLTDCANTEGVLRLIQSVPSAKAEPFKLWLAGLGKQNLEENADPELGFERLTELYKAKGYDDKWIENRLKSIETRKNLTNEWKKRGITEGGDYSKLTAAIAKGTFGLSPTEHSQLKGLEKENLRDHMTPMELIFTALGEEVTRTLAIKNDAQGFHQNYETAAEAGQIAGEARERVEARTGEKVVSSQNFLKNLKDTTTEE